MRPWFVASVSLIAMSARGACAAPATAEQATAIQASLERYVGKGDATTPTVSVKPQGDSYDVTFDVKRILSFTSPMGVVIDPTLYHISVTPQGGPMWRVTTDAPARFSGRFADRSFNLAMNGVHYDGLFDSSIPAFTTQSASYDSISMGAIGDRNGTQTRNSVKVNQTASAHATADGVVDTQTSQTTASFAEDVTIDGSPDRKSTALSLKTGPVAEKIAIEGARIRALMDLWAFLVAHPSPDALKAEQARLRELVAAFLPVVNHATQSTTLEKVTVGSPVGVVGADKATVNLDLNGLVDDGRIGSRIAIDGLSIPQGLAPPWADGVIPTGVDLAETFSGFHLGTFAQKAVAMADLRAPEPFTPAQQDELKTALGPVEQMTVAIAPSRITSRLLGIDLEGQVRLAQPIPILDLKIKATGLDAAIGDIQRKGAGRPEMANVIGGLALIKGYGRAAPDGSVTWEVTRAEGGAILVNGIALPIGASP